jgi:hypothetical protein
MTESETESGEPTQEPLQARFGAKCTVCAHPQLEDIEKAILSRASEHEISCQFSLSKSAINRHKRHSARNSTDLAGRKAELQRRLGKAKDDKDYALLSRELRALEEHEARLQQEAGVDRPLHEHVGFQAFLTHLLNTIGDCDRCREAVLEAAHPGDTRSE